MSPQMTFGGTDSVCLWQLRKADFLIIENSISIILLQTLCLFLLPFEFMNKMLGFKF